MSETTQPRPPGRLQFRPKGTDAPLYSPERDLAYIWPYAMKEALQGLDEVNWSDEVRALQRTNGFNEADLGEAVRCLVNAQARFTGDPAITEPADALQQEGWFDGNCWTIVRLLIMARVGEVIMGGFFVALRDVTRMGAEPPQARDIAEFVAAGRRIAQRTGAVPTTYHEGSEPLLDAIETTTAELEMARRALVRARQLEGELRNDMVARVTALEKQIQLSMQQTGEATDRWLKYERSSLWQLLKMWWTRTKPKS